MSIEWFYAVDGVQYGPVSTEDLRRFIAEKRVAPDDFVWYAAMPSWEKANDVAELVGEPPLFPVAIWKLVLMSLATFGIYEIFWGYKHWKALQPQLNDEIWPFWRGFFGVFFFYPLAKEINREGDARRFADHLPAGALAILFFLLTITWRLPDPYGLIAFLSVFPLAVAQERANAINAKAAPLADRNDHLRGWNWLAAGVGLPVFVLAVIGTFLEV